jgi:hypothetical protein
VRTVRPLTRRNQAKRASFRLQRALRLALQRAIFIVAATKAGGAQTSRCVIVAYAVFNLCRP